MSLLGALQDKQFWRDIGSNANDLGQAASNSVASNVTAPVDGLAWLLRKAGVNMPTPVGGSDWAKNAGLLREVPESPASVTGDTLGMIAPMLMMSKAPEIARGLLQGADNMMANRTMGKQAGKVFVYPQDEALATAQRNAALPVERGGLGLPEGNTPMDRARAMGFTDDAFHGQAQPNPKREYIEGLGNVIVDQPALSPITQLKSSAGNAEQGAFFAVNDPFVANGYAGNGAVYPLKVTGQSLKESGVPSGGNVENFNRMLDKNKSRYFNSELRQAKNEGFGGAVFRNVEDSAGQKLYDIPADIYGLSNPALVRSRFAAFDPMRRNEADLLGQADPALLALIAAGGYGGYKAMEP